MSLKTLKTYPLHYLLLVLLLGLGILGFFSFSYDRSIQETILIFMAIVYVLWGIWHHRLTHLLTPKIVLEYALFATIIVVIINSLLLQK